MIDPKPILALLDMRGQFAPTAAQMEEAIVEIVKATNAELERIVREAFARFGRDFTEQDIAAVLAKAVEVAPRVVMPCADDDCRRALAEHRIAGGSLECPYYGGSDGGSYP